MTSYNGIKSRVNEIKMVKLKHTEPLKEKVYKALLKNIIEGQLAPGEQLVEQSIADALGVSKSPVRDALHRLNGDGLVRGTHFKGFCVSLMSDREFVELMQIRLAMELFCLGDKIDHYSDEDIHDLAEPVERARVFLEKGENHLAHDCHIAFHYLIVQKFGNERMMEQYEVNWRKLKRYLRFNVKQTPERILISNKHHASLMDAIRHRDRKAALERLKEHFADIQASFLKLKGKATENRAL